MAPPLPDPVGQTLEIRNLSIAFSTPRGHARVVDDVSLSIGAGEIVGVIGESGSGKTLTALAVLGMLPRGARIESGRILLAGESMLTMAERERRAIRGDRVAYIPQDALRALNPTLRVGRRSGSL
jgi:peptide/nickel transport system ATP-binding protein